MSNRKDGARTKITIETEGPILPGSVSTARSECGKPNCACKTDPAKLHGVYHRWTGFIAGKRTTRTISEPVAKECERRIKNYRALQQKIEQLTEAALVSAPWIESA